MRMTIELDQTIVEEAMSYAGVKSKRELVDLALREFVAARRRRDVSELFGKVQIDPDYDYKALR
jgi:Arc/MetJ family transcription regulator